MLDNGRKLYTDNFYTPIRLAEKLISKKTYLTETLQKNRRGNPKNVTNKKLKRDENIAMQNNLGVTVMKWKDKQDVLLLSTL